jgi:hypothetical protein
MKKAVLQLIWYSYQLKRYINYLVEKMKDRKTIGEIKQMISSDGLLNDLDKEERENWKKRINTVLESSDNKDIPRHEKAGTIQGDYLIMHNGLKVDPLSYYGLPPLKLLVDNKGVHEPQEEKVFQEVLKSIKPGGLMLELGSYWAFYSMWFYDEVKNATCHMIEAELPNIRFGKKNFRLNNMNGNFYQAFLGDRTFITHKGDRCVTVDDYVKDKQIKFIDMFHSDIQGYEFKMLQGARNTFDQKKVGYVFISTHSEELHSNCRKFLTDRGFLIIADASPRESFSVDGLIAARAPYYEGIGPVPISKRQ